ncbi:hypothetical protein HWV62_33709 [Athelia sp. TMB]|nr:hypothetical protein HWV62_33709 [Athelia sp. TMB]
MPQPKDSVDAVSAGTPIILLPYTVPAYFLTQYAGPTAALTVQFDAALSGMGAGKWHQRKPSNLRRDSTHSSQSKEQSPNNSAGASYIIAWISVENTQGEDKGMTVIWPEALCLSYLPSATTAETTPTHLAYLPTLPTQLQPSPLPPSPPAISFVASYAPSTPRLASHADKRSRSRTADHMRPGLSRRALTASTVDTFHSLSLCMTDSRSSVRTKDLGNVATEVGAFVDSVAREREKERERIRRDREVGGSPPKAGAPSLLRTISTSEVSTATSEIRHSADHNLYTGTQREPLVTSMDQSYPSPPDMKPNRIESDEAAAEPHAAYPPTQESSSTIPEEHIFKDEVTTPIASGADMARPPTPPLSSHPSGPDTFDPFNDINLDDGWAQPQQDFLNLDYDMDFGIPANVGGGGGGAGRTGNQDSMNSFEDGFEFTDDDFSFFDQPAAHPIPGSRVVSGLSTDSQAEPTGLTPAPFGLSPGFYGDLPSGLFPSSSPWHPVGPTDGPTPSLSPPSPGKSPVSHSAPATPNVQFSPRYRDSREKNKLASPPGLSVFDPIPFAVNHQLSDSKYASGKFSQPSSTSLPIDNMVTTNRNERYEAATNPRVGVIRKLIGVKRKHVSQDVRDTKAPAPWSREHEDWESYISHDSMVVEAENAISEESEEEDIDLESPVLSRPSTPLPNYLPLGPTLLQTEFRHSALLPLCSPLRPLGMAVAHSALTPAAAAASVPTPVSPASALGAASEKCKSLEAAAYTVAKEAVENSVWARYATNSGAHKQRVEVWQADAMAVAQSLAAIPSLERALTIKAVLGNLQFRHGLTKSSDLYSPECNDDATSCLEQLEPPMLTVAKSNAIMQVLPSALRFWDRLGLGPRGGRKNVTAFVLFEDEGEDKQLLVERWLTEMSATYSARHLGDHTAGRCSSCSKDGIVPLSFESFRKSLASFVSSLPTFGSSVVFYLVTPSCSVNFASPVFRQVFSAVKKALKTYSDAQIVFQFVPQQLIADSLEHSVTRAADLEQLCHTLYERILVPVDRTMSRRFFEHGERVRNYFQEPAFTLARPTQEKVKFVRQMPPRSLDIVDRHTFLHVGYCVSSCGKWLFATCVDQRGEVNEIGVWMLQGDMSVAQTVAHVWDFAVTFARRANVEWRIVFAKLGLMDEIELDAWICHLEVVVPACHELLPMIHVSLLSVDQDHPWTFLPSSTQLGRNDLAKRSSSKDMARTVYVDAEASTYVVFSATPLALCASVHAPQLSYIPSARETPSLDEVPLLPISSSALIRAPAGGGYTSIMMLQIHLLHTTRSPLSSLDISDLETHKEITRNFYELSVLASERWKFDRANSILPMHLGAVQVMASIIGRSDVESC